MKNLGEQLLCPSAPCSDQAVLLGIVKGDGTIAYFNERHIIDKDFVATASKGRAAEKRFRFASACIEGECSFWTGSECGVVQDVLEVIEPIQIDSQLPNCSIRASCRWFDECGSPACSRCPFMVTNVSEALSPGSSH